MLIYGKVFISISLNYKFNNIMAPKNVNKIGKRETEVQTAHNAWKVMKPFVRFGLKAMGLIAVALIAVIRNIPKPNSSKHPEHKDNNIIRI